MRILYVDDIRTPNFWDNEKINTTICRTFGEAIDKLTDNYDVIDLDHDLGEEKTGYDICKYIVENEIKIPIVVIHTSNPVGRQNMKQLLERYTKSKIIIM